MSSEHEIKEASHHKPFCVWRWLVVTEKNIPVLKTRTRQCSRVRCHHVRKQLSDGLATRDREHKCHKLQHQWSLREGLQKFIALCSQLSQNKIFQTETSGWEKNTTAHGNGWYNRGMFNHLDTHWELPRCLGKIQRRDGVRKARCWKEGIVQSHSGKVTN